MQNVARNAKFRLSPMAKDRYIAVIAIEKKDQIEDFKTKIQYFINLHFFIFLKKMYGLDGIWTRGLYLAKVAIFQSDLPAQKELLENGKKNDYFIVSFKLFK